MLTNYQKLNMFGRLGLTEFYVSIIKKPRLIMKGMVSFRSAYHEEALGDSGEKKLPFNRNKPLAEAASGRRSYLPRVFGDEGRISNHVTV